MERENKKTRKCFDSKYRDVFTCFNLYTHPKKNTIFVPAQPGKGFCKTLSPGHISLSAWLMIHGQKIGSGFLENEMLENG